MPGLLDLLSSDIGKQMISGLSGQTGVSSDKTADVLGMALPILTGAMQKNASNSGGAASLLSAVTGSNHNGGGILDNMDGLFKGGVDDSVMKDGAGILKHVLGSKQSGVEAALGKKSGLDAGSIAQIMKVAAPLLMGVLGKQAKASNVQDANGMGNVLSGLLGGGAGSSQQNMIESFLDADGDGSVVDDLAGMLLGGGKSKSPLGGILGGLFGK